MRVNSFIQTEYLVYNFEDYTSILFLYSWIDDQTKNNFRLFVWQNSAFTLVLIRD